MGPVSTTTLAARARPLQKLELQVTLVGRQITRSAQCADQLAGEIGTGSLTTTARPAGERNLQAFPHDGGLRHAPALGFGGQLGLERRWKFEADEFHERMVICEWQAGNTRASAPAAAIVAQRPA